MLHHFLIALTTLWEYTDMGLHDHLSSTHPKGNDIYHQKDLGRQKSDTALVEWKEK